MQPYLSSSLKGTLVSTKTGTPSSSLGTVGCRTTAKLMLVQRQSGDGANCLKQELDMETTCITTTSTELHTIDNKMIDFGQVADNVFLSDIMGSYEDSVHQNQPADTSKTAIFDVQSEPSVHPGRGLLPFKHTEDLSLPPCVSNMVDSVLLSERPMPSMSSCVSSVGEKDLFLESSSPFLLPSVSGMVNSVLPSERPISPSDFLQKNPSPSTQLHMQDLVMPPDLLDDIDQLLAETSENITWDCNQQLDLTLFSQFEEQDTLNTIVQECGILDEVKESHIYCEGDSRNSTVPSAMTQPSRIQSDCVGLVRTQPTMGYCRKPVSQIAAKSWDKESATTEITVKADLEDLVASTSATNQVYVKEEKCTHYEGDGPNSTVSIIETKPPRIQNDGVGPMRTRQTRRYRRKPARYRAAQFLDDEHATTTEDTVKAAMEDLVASTSGSTFTRGKSNSIKEMSNEEKYIRSRNQNNAASKRSREKRKENFKKMTIELEELERRNKSLQDKVAQLTLLRDNFKAFVNKCLFQKFTQK